MAKLIKLQEDVPLLGLLHIGIIDRGSTLLQVRSTTVCNMRCQFCSTAANDNKVHPYNFQVTPNHINTWIDEAIRLKKNNVTEINIDSVGEPTADKDVHKIIEHVKTVPSIQTVSMQTNGTLLTKQKINQYNDARLDRLNISIHSLDEKQSKELFGNETYSITKIHEALEYLKETNIKVNITPVWLPQINEKEIPKLIQISKDINATIAIQKYEVYKNSRKYKRTKETNWWKFYKQLELWEKEYKTKLKVGPHDFKIYKSQRIPKVFTKGDKIHTIAVAPGWYPNQVTAVSNNRAITILNKEYHPNERTKITITSDANGIYLGK